MLILEIQYCWQQVKACVFKVQTCVNTFSSYDAPGAGDVDASTFAYGLPAE